MHVREILADAQNPIHGYLSTCAHALRLCKKLSRDVCWTLWSQDDLAITLRERVDKLRVMDDFRSVCYGCSKPKSHLLSLAKLDAAHFFKEADPRRGLKRTKLLLDRLTLNRGCNAIRVKKGAKAHGHMQQLLQMPNWIHHCFIH